MASIQNNSTQTKLEESLPLTLSALTFGVWEYDYDQDAMMWSDALWDMLGYASAGHPMDIRTWISHIHPDDQFNAHQYLISLAETDTSRGDAIFRYQHQMGHWLWVHSHGQVISGNTGGSPLKSAGLSLIVTRQQPPPPTSANSLDRAHTLIESIPVGVYTFTYRATDGSMSFDFISDHACSLLGIDKQAVLTDAMVAFDAAMPEDRARLLARNRALEGDNLFHFEGHFMVRGNPRRIRLHSNRVAVGEWGSQWDGVITDITDETQDGELIKELAKELNQKLADHAVALSEASREIETTSMRLSHALDVLHIGIWDWDVRNNKVFSAPEHAFPRPVFSTNGQDLVSHWKSFVHPDDVDKVFASFSAQIKTSDSYELEYRIQNNEGQFHWILSRGRVVTRDDQGNPLRIIGTHTDIDERRKTDFEKQCLASIIEESSDLIAYANFEGQVTYLNAAGRSLLGFSKDEPLENFFIKNAHPDWAFDRVMNEALPVAMAQGFWQGDNIFVARDGSRIDFSQLILIPKDPRSGEALFIATVCRDVSDRKKLESELTGTVAKLEEADRRKDEFLATLAHELRNPLTPVAIATGILQKDGITPEQFKWCVGSISRQTKHLKKLIDDLLDVSRINRGLITLERQPTALNPILVEAVEMFALKAEEKGQRINFHPLKGELHILGDSVRLLQILGNLISNAIKFSPRDAEITVSAKGDRSLAVISIKDQGIGIAPEDQAEVFGLFSQIKEPSSPSNDGLGIGLYLVKHLIDLHGGHIAVQSAGIGKGSEFIIKLPLFNDEAALTDEEAAKPAEGPQGFRILVVDDNLDAQATLAMYLEIQGNQVHTASDGHQAIALAKAQRPQLIILDIGLPGMDGYDVCRQIREQPWGKDIVIVALSGWGQKEDKKKAFASGFDEHFTKPLDLGTLEAFLQQHKDKLC